MLLGAVAGFSGSVAGLYGAAGAPYMNALSNDPSSWLLSSSLAGAWNQINTPRLSCY